MSSPKPPARDLSFLERTSVRVNEAVYRMFKRLGELVYDHTTLFIVVPIVIMIAFAAGLATLDIEYNPEKLYTPQNSESFAHRDYVEEVFGYEDLQMDFYAVSNADEGSNILTKANLLSYLDVYEVVKSSSGTFEGELKTFQNSCRKGPQGQCDIISVLEYWQYNRTVLEADNNILATINTPLVDSLGRTINSNRILGGIVRDGSGNISAAAAFDMRLYQLNNAKEWSDGGTEDRATTSYQRYTAELVRNGNAYGNLRIHTLSEGEQDEEFSAAIQDDIVLLVIGYILLSAFAFSVLSRNSRVHSHGSLALLSVLCVGLAICASFGLLSMLGVTFSLAVQTLAFLLLGLGIDDTFVLMSVFITPGDNPRVRVSRALAIGGSSILVTSLTDCVAFVSGTYTELPAIRAFCLFAAVGVLFDFILQVTLFVAFMVLADKRERAQRTDVFCCNKPEDPQKHCFGSSTEPFDPHKPSRLTKFLVAFARNYLLTAPGKIIVLVVAVVLFATSIWAATKVESNFNIEWFAPDDSYIQDSYRIRDTYFTGRNIPVGFYTKTVDYPNLQDRLEELSTDLENADFILRCSNWFTSFQDFISDRALVDGHAPPAQFYPWLREFLDSDDGADFVDRVVYDSTNTSIVATEIFCQWTEQSDALARVDAMEDSRGVAAKYEDLECFSYTYVFLFLDGIKVIRSQTLINIAMAAAAVLIVTVVLLANIPAAALVFVMLVLVDVNVLGWLYYYNLDFNSVSAVNLVIAVGLAVDSSVHIAHSFLVAKGTKNERAVESIRHLGASVTNGSISTFVAVLPLAFSKSYIFEVFFKCLITIIGFSFFHGMLVLPVVLSLCGPDPYPQEMTFQQELEELHEERKEATSRRNSRGVAAV